jgi:hypothetical protein
MFLGAALKLKLKDIDVILRLYHRIGMPFGAVYLGFDKLPHQRKDDMV